MDMIPTTEFPCLLYLDSNKTFKDIPDWAYTFVQLGKSFVSPNNFNHRRIVVITVPSRAFVAAFLSLGVIHQLSIKDINPQHKINHFNKLKKLQTDTPLFYVQKGKILKVVYKGTEEVYGEERIKVKEKAKTKAKASEITHLLNIEEALNVHITDDNQDDKSGNSRKSAMLHSEFSKKFFEYTISQCGDIPSINNRIWLVGNTTNFKYEYMDTSFAISDNDVRKKGCLNEILRIHRFVGDGIWFSGIISPIARKVTVSVKDGDITIFDGAHEYIKWWDKFLNSHSIVVLDRTHYQYEEAMEVLYDRYISNRAKQNILSLDCLEIPDGTEVIYWEEEK